MQIFRLLFAVAVGCTGSSSNAMPSDGGPRDSTTLFDAPPGPACTVPAVPIAHGTTAPGAFQYVQLAKATYPDAVCNDGSSAAYMIRPGVGAAAKRWVLYLEGGGECFDDTSCLVRANKTGQYASGYTTSNFYRDHPDQLPPGGGILDASTATNPDFYDSTIVYFLYCSSDDWSGAKTGSGAFDKTMSATWNFQGRAIAHGILADLVATRGLHAATEVLLTGSSAGGLGVLVNTNDLAGMLPASVRFLAYSDAAYGNHTQDFSESASPPNYTTTATAQQIVKKSQSIPLWNARGDSVCAMTATDLDAKVHCYDAQTLLGPQPSITNPMLISISQTDDAQLGTAGVSTTTLDTSEAAYVAYFASTLRASFPGLNANVSVYSPDVGLPFVHTEEDLQTVFPTSYAFPEGNISLQSAVGAWYRSPCTPVRHVAN